MPVKKTKTKRRGKTTLIIEGPISSLRPISKVVKGNKKIKTKCCQGVFDYQSR